MSKLDDDELDKILRDYFAKRAKALRRHMQNHRRDPEDTAVDDSVRDITTNAKQAIEALINDEIRIVLDKLIDNEVELYGIYKKDDIAVGIKLMADEVRDMYDYLEENKEINDA